MFKKSKSKSKKVTVDRKFLMNLANKIYSSRNRTFLRLCNGRLQNGLDPTNEKRPMHCGLGELYFAMTGFQPEETGVDENSVIDLALELSPFACLREKAQKEEEEKFEKAEAAILKLNLDDDAKNMLIQTLNEVDREHSDFLEETEREDAEDWFRDALQEIPSINDDGCDDGSCSIEQYRNRSKRVAAQLKEAASYLPR